MHFRKDFWFELKIFDMPVMFVRFVTLLFRMIEQPGK